jgi:hypothetical protein
LSIALVISRGDFYSFTSSSTYSGSVLSTLVSICSLLTGAGYYYIYSRYSGSSLTSSAIGYFFFLGARYFLLFIAAGSATIVGRTYTAGISSTGGITLIVGISATGGLLSISDILRCY